MRMFHHRHGGLKRKKMRKGKGISHNDDGVGERGQESEVRGQGPEDIVLETKAADTKDQPI